MNNSVISTERELHSLQTRRMELTSKVEKMKTLETNIAEAKKRIEEIAVDQKVRPTLLSGSSRSPLTPRPRTST